MNLITARTKKPGIRIIVNNICSIRETHKGMSSTECEVTMNNGERFILNKSTLDLAFLESRLPIQPELYQHESFHPLAS